MMRTSTLKAFLLSAALATASVAYAQTAGQDMKDAGHDTKAAAVDTGRATDKAAHSTVHGTKKAYHKTAHATKTAGHDTTKGTLKATHATENFGDRVADKPQTH